MKPIASKNPFSKFFLVSLLASFGLMLPGQERETLGSLTATGINLLQQFFPGNAHGSNPMGDLASDGAYLYGMTSRLGIFNGGTIFRINGDGSEFLILHAFTMDATDGSNPQGSLLVSGSTLFGMTLNGGNSDKGTIFKMETNGKGFALLHAFAGGVGDGQNPYGSLIQSGTTLYGMTNMGGSGNKGTVFKMQTDGTGFALLHEFGGYPSDGEYPRGSLIISGSTLFGMTYGGGKNGKGTIFKIMTDGSGYSLLHHMAPGDRAALNGSLVISGATLYGMTFGREAPPGDYYDVPGIIFKIGIDGSGYNKLHDFSECEWDFPMGSLFISGTTLYGMTCHSGSIFKIQTNGSGFAILHVFSGGTADGRDPFGSLILSGDTLYGMTGYGGDSNCGTIFKIGIDGGGFTLLHKFAGISGSGFRPEGSLILSGSTFYGMTEYGGVSNMGTIFGMQPKSEHCRLLHEFSGEPTDGGKPWGSLIVSGSTLYGMTYIGGSHDLGSIFKIETDGSSYTLLHSFAKSAENGYVPMGSLALSGSTLYGMTFYGGHSDKGTIFKIETDGSGFSLLHEFSGGADDGNDPWGSLIISGSTLYGMTLHGGDSDKGTIFRIQADGSDFVVMHEFTGGPTDGGIPHGDLTLSGSTLYGMSYEGGDHDKGTIFKIGTDGGGFSLLHEFAGGADDGRNPYGSLILSDSILYGMTHSGGDQDKGTIFKIGTDSSGFVLLHGFAGGASDGAYPRGSLILSGSLLYGMTYRGGKSDMGVIFSLPIPGAIFIDFTAERHDVRTLSILRQYGQIQFVVADPIDFASQYCILRRQGSDDFVQIKTIAPSELQDNKFIIQDKYLNKDTSYTYQVEAYNVAGQVVGRSAEKTI